MYRVQPCGQGCGITKEFVIRKEHDVAWCGGEDLRPNAIRCLKTYKIIIDRGLFSIPLIPQYTSVRDETAF